MFASLRGCYFTMVGRSNGWHSEGWPDRTAYVPRLEPSGASGGRFLRLFSYTAKLVASRCAPLPRRVTGTADRRESREAFGVILRISFFDRCKV